MTPRGQRGDAQQEGNRHTRAWPGQLATRVPTTPRWSTAVLTR